MSETLRTLDGVAVGPDDIVWRYDAGSALPAGELDPEALADRWYSSERIAIVAMIRDYEASIRYESDQIEELKESVLQAQRNVVILRSRLNNLPD